MYCICKEMFVLFIHYLVKRQCHKVFPKFVIIFLFGSVAYAVVLKFSGRATLISQPKIVIVCMFEKRTFTLVLLDKLHAVLCCA